MAPKISRRDALVAVVATGVGAVAGVLARDSTGDEDAEIARLKRTQDDLEVKVRRLSYNTASGGGVNLKLMQDPATGEATVPLEEHFSFDRNHAICRVATNPVAFKMKTYSSGEVVVPKNRFFMSMLATTVDQFTQSAGPAGTRKVIMRGGLSCKTEVGLTTVTVGSRTAAEHAKYKIEAVDGGAGDNAADSFAFTAYFEKAVAPVNHSIFGPEFTFTGKMTEGKVTIVDPNG